jgi:hypothetical protein
VSPHSNEKEVLIIEKVTVTVMDEGVKLYIKSPILHEWMKGRAEKLDYADKGEVWFPLAALPPEWDWHMNVIKDSFDANNLFWLLSKNLDEGFEHLFSVPVLVPAELSDYIQTLCQNASKVYSRYVNKAEISGALRVQL